MFSDYENSTSVLAGRSRAARVGNRVVAGIGGGPSCAPGIPTAAGRMEEPGRLQSMGSLRVGHN